MNELLSDPRYYKLYEEEKAKRRELFGEGEDRLTVALTNTIYDMVRVIAVASHTTLEEIVKAFIMVGVERVANGTADMPERKTVSVDAETYDLVHTIGAALGGSPDAIAKELIEEAFRDLAEKQEDERDQKGDNEFPL